MGEPNAAKPHYRALCPVERCELKYLSSSGKEINEIPPVVTSEQGTD